MAAKLQLYPKSRQEWLRFVFYTLETLVAGMSIKMAVAEMNMPLKAYVDDPTYLSVLFLGVIALAVISWLIRPHYASLADLGWFTAFCGLVVVSFRPAIT